MAVRACLAGVAFFDVVVVVVLVGALAVGAELGAVRATLSLVGLALGLVGAFTLTRRWMLAQSPDAVTARNVIFVAGFLGLPLLGWVLGGAMARALGTKRARPLALIERVGGAVVAAFAVVAFVWLVVPASRTSPVIAAWTASSETSHVLESFPAPPVDVGALIGQDIFPAQLTQALGVEDVSNPPSDLPAMQPGALPRAEAASVQVLASAWGGFNLGSGFAVRSDLVATNAHVVAGSDGNVRVVASGKTMSATVVLFDPGSDLALLAYRRRRFPNSVSIGGPSIPRSSSSHSVIPAASDRSTSARPGLSTRSSSSRPIPTAAA